MSLASVSLVGILVPASFILLFHPILTITSLMILSSVVPYLTMVLNLMFMFGGRGFGLGRCLQSPTRGFANGFRYGGPRSRS